LKVLEAFSSGLPVVSTEFGCEGLGAEAGRHFLHAETPDEFVDRVGQLISEPESGQEIATEARRLVEEYYDWKWVIERAEAVWEGVARRPPKVRR
jgi:glycosyltransferase involved in cell wall biosynthesis